MTLARTLRLSVIALCFAGSAATAQPTDYEAIVRVMRQCARIAEIDARVACYDNAVSVDAAVSPLAEPVEQPGSRPAPPPAGSQPAAPPQFGQESLRRPSGAESERPAELSARVTAAAEREPGIYLLTLSDGTQWALVEPAPRSYDPPRPGSAVIVSRGALGSFFLNYERRSPLRVRRVR
jgi:hypothetical protein